MTTEEILAQVAAGKLSPGEAQQLMGSKGASAKGGQGLLVKRNAGGGVFIRHPKFTAHSESKNKDYVAGINLPESAARLIFAGGAEYQEIARAVNDLLGKAGGQ